MSVRLNEESKPTAISAKQSERTCFSFYHPQLIWHLRIFRQCKSKRKYLYAGAGGVEGLVRPALYERSTREPGLFYLLFQTLAGHSYQLFLSTEILYKCSRSIVLSVSVRYLFLHSSSAVISFIRSSLLLSCGIFGCTVKQEGTSSHRCTYWVLVLVPWVVW